MDACDPGVDLNNLRTLVKQNTGNELRLSRKEVCDVYASIQGGKLPLPPLILSKDGSYMIDRKSPLSQKEYKKLFSASTKVSSIRHIANKVGVARYADKKLTKAQLIDIIGRRLHSMNVHEPIKLRSVQIKHIEKYGMNENVNVNVNRMNENVNVNRMNENVNVNVNRKNINESVNVNRKNVNESVNVNRKNVNESVNVNRKNVNVNVKRRNVNESVNVNRRNIRNYNKPAPRTFSKPKKPTFLNRSFIPTNKIKPMPGYVFKRNIRGLGMYKNKKPNVVTGGIIQGPARGPVEGPKALETRNREIKENEILLRSYLNRENVSKYINNSQKTNAFNRVKRGTKFNNVKTYINGIISTKITNEQRLQNQKIKLEQNRNELQKILSELTNLTNTNKNEILRKFNSNGKLNNAKTLAIQKDRDIKKSKLENLKTNLTTFLGNKNVNNKGTYINRLNAGEDISNLKREIMDVINKKEAERKNYDLKLKELSVLLNSSKNLNNSMKAKFLRNFEKTKNFNKVRKNVEDEFKKINNARKEGEITFRNADQKKLLQKIIKNFSNDDKRMFMQRLEAGNNFNTLKDNAIQAARNLKKERKNRELEQKMKAEAEYKEKQRRQQKELLNKFMNNSNYLNNAERNVFRQRFNSGENFNTLKKNINKRTKNLEAESVRKEKERLEKQEKKRIRNEQRKLLIEMLNNSKNMTKENKAQFLERFNKGEKFNIIKGNASRKAQNLERNRLQKEKNEANRLAKEKNSIRSILKETNALNSREVSEFENRIQKSNTLNNLKNIRSNVLKSISSSKIKAESEKSVKRAILNSGNIFTNENKNEFLRRVRENGNLQNILKNIERRKEEAIRKAKEEENRKAKEEENRKAEANRLAKEEAIRLAKEKKLKEKYQKSLSKLLNSSKNLTNANKVNYLKRFEKGENYNALRKNVVNKIRNLAKQRKLKEEEQRKAKEKEEMIEKKKAEALAKKKKEEEEKKKREEENKKKAAKNQKMRESLTNKVKSTQMNQKVKNKLLNQLKNYRVQIKNIAPSIEKVIESEKLNGNYNEAANKKKRQEVKKQLAEYISKTYPNMTNADRKKYINSANLTQWRKGIFTGSQGMEANRAFNRIKGNIKRNMDEKKRKNVQAKLIKAMQNKPPPPPRNKKANLKKLVNNTMKGRAAKNVSRLKKNINEGITEIAVKTRLAQLNKQTKYQQK